MYTLIHLKFNIVHIILQVGGSGTHFFHIIIILLEYDMRSFFRNNRNSMLYFMNLHFNI